MTIVECPTCSWPLILPDARVGATFVCLNCNVDFNTGTANVQARHTADCERKTLRASDQIAGEEAASSTSPRRATSLTHPHLCDHCQHQLTATGQRRTTVTCPGCERPTSVYAVLYHCPECEALLESPRSRIGKQARCPKCNDYVTVPSDVLYNDDRNPPTHEWYAFPCVHCQFNHQARQSLAGTFVVCTNCLLGFEAPRSGEPVLPASHSNPESCEHLSTQLERHCPHCGIPMPRHAVNCRRCGGKS